MGDKNVGLQGLLSTGEPALLRSPDMCQWGGSPHKGHPHLVLGQVIAAATILLPVATSLAMLSAATCSMEGLELWQPAAGAVVAFALIVPGSLANHLGHAICGHWVIPCQKMDRAGVVISASVGSWALSQNAEFSALAALASCATVLAMLCGPAAIKNDCNLLTICVGVIVMYNLTAAFIFRSDWDPFALPAAASLGFGLAVFAIDPFGVWTDAVWHLALATYAYFITESCVALQCKLYGGCC
eukprot:gb/GFBE01013743.1/.p1 GENE.gb/GFBE01013743.1/~~gb/GFBE01013743.1/.p1  ORF type:complete len:243 (+),score=52.67 gb/GFBE01013743.1/:1-729(+)